MSNKTSANVPQVVGKELESTRELMDGFGKREKGGGGYWERIILDVTIFVGFSGLRNDGEGRGLEGADERLKILVRDWSNVALLGDLVLDNPGEFFGEFGDRWTIGGCLGGGD